MIYIPNTDADRASMLEVIGVEHVHDLFNDVPEAYRFPTLNLPPRLSEAELLTELRNLSEENADLAHHPCFLGAGAYRHFIPSVVDYVLSRGEFYTAYTPYQPEVSQGTLQALFEYQTLVARLAGLDVANGSHYDGATATAEAVIMALHVGRLQRKKVILSPYLHPQYRSVVRTYTQGMNLTIVGDELQDGERLNLEQLEALIDQETACVVVQNPDFLGRLYTPAEMQAFADAIHAQGALFVVAANPVSLGLFQAPGAYGADVYVGEGQALGNTLSFGGPYVGLFACRMEHVRRSAGRIAGETVNRDGERGFVLTLSTREQHIRRQKATSNICTNQALNALAVAVYLAAMGKQGLRRVAELCYHKAHYAAEQIAQLDGYEVLNASPFFHEFVVRCDADTRIINRFLFEEFGIIGGYRLEQDYPELENHLLLCVTELNTRNEIDELVEALAEALDQSQKPETIQLLT